MKEKMRLKNYYPNTIIEIIFIKKENSKANEHHKFVLNLLQRLDLRISNKPEVQKNKKIVQKQ